jgi:GntR family transcriptional regulator
VRLVIDSQSGVPFYRQIIEQVKFAISRGDLQPGDQLPTVRQLAVDLSINPNTVVRAYRQLETESVLETQQGSGTFVGRQKPEIDRLEKQRMLDQILRELLARGSNYGFTLDDMLDGLRQRKEESS